MVTLTHPTPLFPTEMDIMTIKELFTLHNHTNNYIAGDVHHKEVIMCITRSHNVHHEVTRKLACVFFDLNGHLTGFPFPPSFFF